MIVKVDVAVHHLTRTELGQIHIFIQKGDRRLKGYRFAYKTTEPTLTVGQFAHEEYHDHTNMIIISLATNPNLTIQFGYRSIDNP